MTPARCRCSGLTRDVQMTSRRLMFIQLSQLTRCPLYVSPFFSSTSCERTGVTGRRYRDVPGVTRTAPARGAGLGRAAGTHHGVVLRRLQQGQGQLRGEERREASGTDRQRDTGRGTDPSTERGTGHAIPGVGGETSQALPTAPASSRPQFPVQIGRAHV